MTTIETVLWEDYNRLSDLITVITSQDERKKELLDERDRIRNELIKLEQAKDEVRIKREQIEAENKREKIRNQITIGTFSITTLLSLYAIVKTFKFDQESTVTSTLGRNLLNNVVSKLFNKR